jgi:hypothetical protein
MRADRLWRTRKEKKEWARRLQSNDLGLDVIHPQAAGIDVGKRFPLCGGASGSRSGTGTPVRVFHGRSVSAGGLAEELWGSDGSDSFR